MSPDWNLIIQAVGTVVAVGAMIFGSTWKLSGKISNIETKLDAHIASDTDKFNGIEADLNTIAPRTVPLRATRR